jgi:hypothetical protein
MPRTSSDVDLNDVFRKALAPVLERASAAISRTLAEMVEERISGQLARAANRGPQRGGRGAAARRARNVEMTKWTADRRARRVPNFVIEATGLDTKKKIVAKFGEGVTFERGRPLPPPKKASDANGAASHDADAAGAVRAKGPRVRKASAK